MVENEDVTGTNAATQRQCCGQIPYNTGDNYCAEPQDYTGLFSAGGADTSNRGTITLYRLTSDENHRACGDNLEFEVSTNERCCIASSAGTKSSGIER